MSEEPVRRPPGSVAVYALAFVLVGLSAYMAILGNTKSSLKFVWASIAFSGLASVLALVSVVFPRR